MFSRDDLHKHLEHTTKVFKNARVQVAFESVDRAHFLPEEYHDEAYEDYAVHYGVGKRMMKPTAAAYLLELAHIEEQAKVLIVGVETGWFVALTAAAVGSGGDAYAVEASQEHIDTAEAYLAPYQFEHAQVFHGENTIGLQDLGPYDRIIVTKELPDVPDVLVDQLAKGGVLVVPTEDGLVQIMKDADGKTTHATHESFNFEPLSLIEPTEDE